MMKNKTTRIIVNGVVLAGLAALGITVYQLGTTPVKENELPEEILVENEGPKESEEEETPMVDAGTSSVEAELEDAALDGEPSETDSQVQEPDGRNSDSQEPEADDQAAGEETAALDMTAQEDTPAAAVTMPEPDFSEDTPMEWPVNGNILLDYSMDQTTYFPTLDQYKLNPAIAVQAEEGTPVMAAVSGTVFSIEQDARTGTTVTMELGNGYQAIYGQLGELAVAEGDTVAEGSIIGYVSAPTKYYSVEGSNLYFAMKQNGEPIDPIAYLP